MKAQILVGILLIFYDYKVTRFLTYRFFFRNYADPVWDICCCWRPFDCLLLLASILFLTPLLLLESLLLLLVHVVPTVVRLLLLASFDCLLLLASLLLLTYTSGG
jgi:hypothetical protein